MKTGRIPYIDSGKTSGGLCSIFSETELFEPTKEDCWEYRVETWGYWGVDFPSSVINCQTSFGPTRQNIVLLLAAINGEL